MKKIKYILYKIKSSSKDQAASTCGAYLYRTGGSKNSIEMQ
jgi:hypothetical protein